ncbi:MAG: hypothetical protein AAFO96_29700, partial [Bacteroidota bacterium]
MYLSETPWIAMLVGAGFQKDANYFVPRSEIKVPFSIASAVFPMLPSLRRHARPEMKAAHNFCTLLDWFSRIVCQDGIYVLKELPQTAMAKSLRKIQGYEEWASETFRELSTLPKAVENPNIDGQVAEAIRDLKSSFVAEISETKNSIRDLRNSLQMPPFTSFTNDAAGASALLHMAGQNGGNTSQKNNSGKGSQSGSRPHTAPEICRLQDVSNMTVLLHEWLEKNLQQYRLLKKAHWSNALKQTFNTRQFLFRKIEERAQQHRSEGDELQKLEHAARTLDEERKGLSMPAYARYLRNT